MAGIDDEFAEARVRSSEHSGLNRDRRAIADPTVARILNTQPIFLFVRALQPSG